MATFKIKHDKTKNLVQINTLDETHKKFMSSFQNRRSLLPNKKRKIDALKRKLIAIENTNGSTYTNEIIKQRASLKSEIDRLEEEINDIENDLSELDYYFKTEDIIMDYYEIMDVDDHALYNEHPELCEAKQEVVVEKDPDFEYLDKLNNIKQSKRKMKKVSKRRKKRPVQSTQLNILDFFNGVSQPKTVILSDTPMSPDATESESNIMSDVMECDDTPHIVIGEIEELKNKSILIDQFMMLVDSEYFNDKKQVDSRIRKCADCGIEKTLFPAEGMFVCQSCGAADMVIMDSEKPNYKEAASDTKPGYPYKRSNHLNFYLTFVIYLNE